MDNRTVSVVIPTYNRAYCLPVAIGSLQRQTYTNWEALIIDDGSTDDTAEVIRAMAAEDPRIRYFHQRNAGVSAARNAGIRIAEGDWVGFLDSDDAWESWKLSAQVACFDNLPDVGMVWTDMDAFDADGKLVSRRHLRKMYSAYKRIEERKVFQGERRLSEFAPDVTNSNGTISNALVRWGDLYSPMIFGSLVHTSTVLISKPRLRAVGFFDEGYRTGEDYDFHLRTCLEGPVALLDVPSIRYRVAGGSDQLTAPAYTLEMAMNALRIREKTIASNRARIQLSDSELAKIMARANSWIAGELFRRGDFEKSRPYFWRSGLLDEPNLSRIVKASLAHFPSPVAGSILSMMRKVKSKARRPGR
ncbi:MAG: glycosyltransferase family 2 protein [Myxococcota bacterium]